MHRTSYQAEKPSLNYLAENACLGMSINEFEYRIKHPRKRLYSGERISIIFASKDYYDIGTGGKVGARVNFVQGKLVGHSLWRVEMAGFWSGPTRTAFTFRYIPCLKDENEKIQDISFSVGNSEYLGLRGTTTRELRTISLGEYQIVNWYENVGEEYQEGRRLPANTQVEVEYRHNNQVYEIGVLNEPGVKTLYIPNTSRLDDFIDFKAGLDVPDFIK